METEIKVALITAATGIIVALINKCGKSKDSNHQKNKVKQNAIGKGITQIGIQNIRNEDDKNA